jgi:spore coat protein CotH
MGLPAPRVAHAKVYVNGTYAGLYTIVEPVDRGFLKRSPGEDGGHRYDYEWTSEYWFEYLGDDPAAYSPYPFQPETNERSPDPRPLVEMIRVINQSADAEFLAALSRYLDPKHFLSYLAVEMFLAEADGLAGEWGLNNFYLYRLQGSAGLCLSLGIRTSRSIPSRDPSGGIWSATC